MAGWGGAYDPSDPLAAMRMAQQAIADSPLGSGPLSHLPMVEGMEERLAQATEQIQANMAAMETSGGVAGVAAVGGMAAAGASAGSSGSDAISQLERLAALRNTGALTDKEFAEQKRRVLDDG